MNDDNISRPLIPTYTYLNSLAVAIITSALALACSKPNQMEVVPNSETMQHLSALFNSSKLQLMKESGNQFSFTINGELIELDDSELATFSFKQNRVHVDSGYHYVRLKSRGATFYMVYNQGDADVMNHFLKSNHDSDSSPEEYVLFYDHTYRLIASTRKSDNDIDDQVRLLKCKSDNVLGCMEDNCRDVHPLVCGGCLLSKWCAGGLAAGCAIDVLYGIERDIYCEK